MIRVTVLIDDTMDDGLHMMGLFTSSMYDMLVVLFGGDTKVSQNIPQLQRSPACG